MLSCVFVNLRWPWMMWSAQSACLEHLVMWPQRKLRVAVSFSCWRSQGENPMTELETQHPFTSTSSTGVGSSLDYLWYLIASRMSGLFNTFWLGKTLASPHVCACLCVAVCVCSSQTQPGTEEPVELDNVSSSGWVLGTCTQTFFSIWTNNLCHSKLIKIHNWKKNTVL